MDLFGTAGIRGPVTDISPALALDVGRAVADRLADTETESIVIARDGRETGPALANALEAGLTSGGLDVLRAGQLPTPALAFASRGRHGVMVTASHNPPADNGIKLFSDGSEYDQSAEADIEERLDDQLPVTDWDRWGTSESCSALSSYNDAVIQYARAHGSPLEDLQIAVDCGNGMASVATPEILTSLGADVRALNASVDGHFPARESKPTAESLTTLRKFVVNTEMAVGIGHDGDGDRIVIVDSDGEVVHEDTVLAILAGHYVERAIVADPVVLTTPNASGRIDEYVEKSGGRVERVRLGALHEGIARVRNQGSSETAVVFAAEPWKHIHPEFGEWIDAIASAAIIARVVATDGLPKLRAEITELPYRKESVPCPDQDKSSVMRDLRESIPPRCPEATVDEEYGLRLDFSDGSWVLLRPSGTEPYIRIYAESQEVDELIETVIELVEETIPES